MNLIPEISEAAFTETILTSDRLYLVDFFAPWCAPCTAMLPALMDLAQEYQGEIELIKVDIDTAPELVKRYALASVPTFLLISNGEVVGRVSGTQTRSKLASLIEGVLP